MGTLGEEAERMRKGRAWTPEEDKVLLAGIKAGKTYAQIAAELGRSEPSVLKRTQRLRVSKSASRPWTQEEMAYLRKHWGRQTAEETARVLGRSIDAVRGKAHALGLTRKFERAASETQGPQLQDDDVRRVFAGLSVGDEVLIEETLGERAYRHVGGTVVSVQPYNITLKVRRGWRESFSVVDVLTGRIKIKVLRRAA